AQHHATAVLDLEPAHVPHGQVVVDPHVGGLADIDARVVGTGGHVAGDPAVTAVGGKDAVLGVVVRGVVGHDPIVDAHQEDAFAAEAVDREALDAHVPETLGGVGQAGGP